MSHTNYYNNVAPGAACLCLLRFISNSSRGTNMKPAVGHLGSWRFSINRAAAFLFLNKEN